MKRAIVGTLLLTCLAGLAFSQSPEAPPKFDIADVHVSPKSVNQFVRTTPVRNGRYEIKNASMVDLIRLAYGFDTDKVLGGPSWLEMERFDVTAKVPADSTPESQKLMLQSLLQERFKLVIHKDTRPLPAYALLAGKKPKLKESDGAGDTGCKAQAGSSAPADGAIRLMMSSSSGVATTINLGPGMTVDYVCRNMTMAAFAEALRTMIGASLGTNPVLDQTELKGAWNFDLKYSMQLIGAGIGNLGDRITIFDAVDKQLGLKLEERQVPTPVIVVDSVNKTPSDNPPGVSEALPVIPAPTEFEVASVKPSDPAERGGRFQMQPGGRVNIQGMPLRFLISRAFNTNNNDQVVGLPNWADSERFDVIAKAPGSGAAAPAMDTESTAPMIRALLVDRFKMTYHSEDRQLPAYSLVAGKPKIKKADPASRTSCKTASAPASAPAGSRMLTCQNVTMAQFADRLQNLAPGLNWPVLDATGLEGGWDFNLIFSQVPMMMNMAGRVGDAPPAQPGTGLGAAVPSASEPVGGYTIFEAVEKQLGLKLEMQKRSLPVTVIDHIEQKPTEN